MARLTFKEVGRRAAEGRRKSRIRKGLPVDHSTKHGPFPKGLLERAFGVPDKRSAKIPLNLHPASTRRVYEDLKLDRVLKKLGRRAPRISASLAAYRHGAGEKPPLDRHAIFGGKHARYKGPRKRGRFG